MNNTHQGKYIELVGDEEGDMVGENEIPDLFDTSVVRIAVL